MTDIAALREMLERATEGPWRFMPWHIEEGPPAVRAPQGHVLATTASDADAEAIATMRNSIPALLDEIEAIRRAMFICAPSFQGGHSDRGRMIAEVLGIPFPVSMDGLRSAAAKHGYAPYDLWPWLQELEEQRAKDQETDR